MWIFSRAGVLGSSCFDIFDTLVSKAYWILSLLFNPLFYAMIFYCSCSSSISLGSIFSYSYTFRLIYPFFLVNSLRLSSFYFKLHFSLFMSFLDLACSWFITSICSLYIRRVFMRDYLSSLKASARVLLWLLKILSDISVWSMLLYPLNVFVLSLFEPIGLSERSSLSLFLFL